MANTAQLALRNQDPRPSLGAEVVDLGGASSETPDGSPDGLKAAKNQDTSASSSAHAPVGAEPRPKLGEDDEDPYDSLDDIDIDFVDDDDDDAYYEEDDSKDDEDKKVDEDDDSKDDDKTVSESRRRRARRLVEEDDDDKPAFLKDKEKVDEDDDSKDDDKQVDEDDDSKDDDKAVDEDDDSKDDDKKIEESRRRARRLVEEDSDDDKDKKVDEEDDSKDDEDKKVDEDDDSKDDDKKIEESRIRVKLSLGKDVAALMQGDSTLSEGFKKHAKVIFESAIKRNVRKYAKVVAESYRAKRVADRRAYSKAMVSKIDDFMSYVAEEWVKQNQLAVESGLRAELAEDFMTGLKQLFTEHYIDVPQSKVNVVEALAKKVDALTSRLDESESKNVALTKQLHEERRSKIFEEIASGLADTDRAELTQLCEDIQFTSEKQYRAKLGTLKEAYFNGEKTAKTPSMKASESAEASGASFLKEEREKANKPESTPTQVDSYVNAARRIGTSSPTPIGGVR